MSSHPWQACFHHTDKCVLESKFMASQSAPLHDQIVEKTHRATRTTCCPADSELRARLKLKALQRCSQFGFTTVCASASRILQSPGFWFRARSLQEIMELHREAMQSDHPGQHLRKGWERLEAQLLYEV